MLPADTILKLSQQSSDATRQADAMLTRLDAKIADIEADGGLPRDQQIFKIKQARDAALPAMIEQVKFVRGIAEQMNPHRAFWENNVLVLAQQRFTEPASSDAVIKDWHAKRLARLPLPQLALEFQHAKRDKNLALLALVLTERMGRALTPHEPADQEAFSLDGLDLPGQAVALKGIDTAEVNRKLAEDVFSRAAGTRISGARKLAVARMREDAGKRDAA